MHTYCMGLYLDACDDSLDHTMQAYSQCFNVACKLHQNGPRDKANVMMIHASFKLEGYYSIHCTLRYESDVHNNNYTNLLVNKWQQTYSTIVTITEQNVDERSLKPNQF